MSHSTNRPPNLLARVRRAAQAEPRKAAALACLLLLLGVLAGRQFLGGASAGPAVASGAAGAAGAADLDGRGGNAAPTAAGGAGTSGLEGASPVQAWLEGPAIPLSRNLFAVKVDLFPTEAPPASFVESDRPGFWDEIAKSLLDHADQQDRRQKQLSTVQAQASALQVTSVLMGARPRAVINGELVGEGDVVAAFRVLKIEARRIVIEREGIRLEITMK